MDTYADELAALVEALDLKDAVHIGHSTGGGEVVRYIARHGTKRVAKAAGVYDCIKAFSETDFRQDLEKVVHGCAARAHEHARARRTRTDC